MDLEEFTVDPASEIASPRDRGFRWRITPDGEALDVLRLAQGEKENAEIWGDLPGHSWGLVGIAKPAATYELKDQNALQLLLRAQRNW